MFAEGGQVVCTATPTDPRMQNEPTQPSYCAKKKKKGVWLGTGHARRARASRSRDPPPCSRRQTSRGLRRKDFAEQARTVRCHAGCRQAGNVNSNLLVQQVSSSRNASKHAGPPYRALLVVIVSWFPFREAGACFPRLKPGFLQTAKSLLLATLPMPECEAGLSVLSV